MPGFPSRADWLFSLRSFAAAALALWIAFSLDLPRPYWAVGTVYIVSQTFTGALRAKALWRLIGTFCGGVFSVLAMPNLIDEPILFSLAVALWIGLCLAASLYDPTPRSYGFMLSGYTAALICFPMVDSPGTIFDTAIYRVIETSLGILCALLMHGILFPRPSAPRLLAATRAWLNDLARYAADSLTAPHDPVRFSSERRRIGRDGAALLALFQQARYEAPHRRAQLLWLPRLHERARALPTLLTAIGERVRTLAVLDPSAAAALRPLLADMADWMAQSIDVPAGPARTLSAHRMEGRLRDAEQLGIPAEPWAALVREGLLERLRELVEQWRECRLLTERLLAERPQEAAPTEPDRPPGHVDPLLVGLSGLAAGLALLLGCALWIGTGWAHGSSLAMMGAVALCIFGQLDDPAPALKKFITGSILAVAIAGLYQFAILPMIDGFPLLILALAPLYLVAGALIAQPAVMAQALAVAVTVPTVMSLQETYSASADFAAYLDGGFATVGGLILALAITRLVRSFGVAWRVHRLMAADRRDLASMAEGGAPADLRRILGVMLDRFEALAARLTAIDAQTVRLTELAELRAALNVLRLREGMAELPRSARAATEATLAAVAATARGRLPAPALLERLDAALQACLSARTRPARRATLALSGLRLALFPDAAPPAMRSGDAPQPEPARNLVA
ncbi:FUSC family protein [Roseomonas sp. E05]|uniref:FUSC family protein n=1 Tax=Roseomonas sp. E05 TaxID=3046310 RepID=UPI0024BAED99|nr:FUSC family protein [Roseomonas sp. E05]MDJ0389757.1 FUSC family protein [Roseomonas sp. E05]